MSIVAGALFCIVAPQAHALTLSGTVYQGDTVQPVSGTYTIRIAVATSTVSLHSTTTTPTGAWSFAIPGGHTIGTATPIVVWVDGDASFRAAAFTKASSTTNNITRLDLYKGRVIVRNEATTATSTTIGDLALYDSDNDTDIQFTANSGTLSVNKGNELYIWQNSIFYASGTVTVNGNAGTSTDGSLYVAGTYIPSSTTTVAGNLTFATSSTYYPNPQGIVLNATTTGKYITHKLATGTPTLGNLNFTGTGGAWQFASDNATVTNMTIGTNATVTAPLATLVVKGNLTQNGQYRNNSGTLVADGYGTTLSGIFTGTSSLAGVTLRDGIVQSVIASYDTTETAIDSVVIDSVNGVLYAGSNTGGIIYRCVLSTGCDASGDFTTAYSTSQSYILAMTIDTTSNVLYVATGFDGVIYRCVLSTGCDASGDFTTAADTTEFWMYSITIDQVNGVLYTGTGNGGIIYRCELSTNCDATGDFTTAYDTSEGEIQSLVVDQTNGVLYAGSGTGGIIYRCLLSTGCDASGDFTTAYDTTTSYIYALIIEPTIGALYVGTGNGGIIHRCLLSTGCDASGDFTTAYDTTEQVIYEFAIDTANGILYVASGSTNGLLYRCFLNTLCDDSSDFTTATDTTQFAFYSVVVHEETGVVYGGAYPGGVIYRYTPGGTDTLTLSNNTKLTNLSIGSYATVTAPSELTVGGTFTNTGSFAAGTSTVFLTGARNTVTGSMIATSSFNNVTIGGPQRFGTTSTTSLYGGAASDPTAFADQITGSWGDDTTLYVTGACYGCGNLGDYAYHTIAYRKTDGAYLWSTTTDPTTLDDIARDIWGDDTALYVTGHCNGCGNLLGQEFYTIAYRKSDGAYLWATTTDSLASATAGSDVWADSTTLYVGGYCEDCGNQGGAAFHTIAYRKSDGAYLWSTTTDPTASYDYVGAVSGDETALYVTGYCDGCGNRGSFAFHTIAYRKSDGAFLWSTTTDPSAGADLPISVTQDESYVYVVGMCGQCKIEGFNIGSFYTIAYRKSDGAYYWSTSTNENIVNDEWAVSVNQDGENLYVTGYTSDSPSSFSVYTVLYRKTDGAFLWSTTTDLAIGEIYPVSAWSDESSLYVTGSYCVGCESYPDQSYLTLKYDKRTGALFNGENTATFGGSASTTGNFYIQNGGLTATNTVIAPTSLTIGGNYTNYDTFVHASGTVTMSSSSAQVFAGYTATSSPFNTLVIDGAGAKSFADKFTVAYDTPYSRIGASVIDVTNRVLYVGTDGGGVIYRCALSTGCDESGDFTTAYDSAEIAILSFVIDTTNGVLYAGTGLDGLIYRCALSTSCDASGDFTTVLNTSYNYIHSLTIDATNGVLYAGTYTGGVIYRCVLSTGCDASGDFAVAYGTSESDIHSLAIDATNGVLYAGTFSNGLIYRCVLSTGCDASGDFTTAYDTSEGRIHSLMVDSTNGVLYAGSGWSGIIYRCLLSTSCDSSDDFTTAFDAAELFIYAFTVDTENNVLYVGAGNYAGDYSGVGGVIYRCALSTGCNNSSDFILAYDVSEDYINTIVFDDVDNVLYAGSDTTGIMYRCATITGCDIGLSQFQGNNVNIQSGGHLRLPSVISLSGSYTNNGTTTAGTSTRFYFNGGSTQTILGNMTGSSTLPSLFFSGQGVKTFSSNASTSENFDIAAGATVVSPTALTIAGNFTQNGAFTNNGGTVHLSGLGRTATGTFTGASALSTLSVSAGGLDSSSITTAYNSTSESYIVSLVIDSINGVLYAGSGSGGIIYRCVLTSGCDAQADFVTAYDTTESYIYSLVIDGTNGVLYIGTNPNGIIYRCVLSTGCDASGDFTTAYDTAGDTIRILTIDTANNVLYIGTAGSTGVIYRCALSTSCDTSGDFTTSYNTGGSAYMYSFAIDATSNVLYVGTAVGGVIYRCVLSTDCDASGDFTVAYDTSESFINALAIDSINGVLYAGSNTTGVIYRCALSTSCDASGDFTIAYDTPQSHIVSMIVDSTNGILYVGTSGNGIIFRCSVTTNCDTEGDFTTAYDTAASSIYALVADTASGALYIGVWSDGIIYRRAGGPVFGANASTTNLTIQAGKSLTAPTQLSISGNYTNSGVFIAGSGTTTFTGTSPQTISGNATGTSAWSGLVLQGAGTKTFSNGASTTNVYIETTATTSWSTSFSASGTVQVITPGAKIELPASATSTIAYLTIAGTAGNEVKLRSTTPGTKAGLAITGAASVTYADIKDSSATSTSGLIDASNSIDAGNNNGWLFLEVAGNATISSGANQTFALNYPTTTISTITITDAVSPSITSANDLRIVIATSSVNMRWDTTDTTATFDGTAVGKVSNPVSYEGNGSILVIPVDTNFSTSDTLTIADLSFTQFAAINVATTAVGVRAAGAGSTTAARDDKYVTVTGSLTLSEHSQSQVSDSFLASSDTQVELYRYIMAPSGESMTASTTMFTLSGVNGVNQEDLSNLQLYKDNNANGTYEAGDLQVGGAGVLAITGQTGTITFSTAYSATTSYNYLLIGDVASIRPGDQLTISLAPEDIEAGGLVSLGTVPPVGSASRIQHIKGGMGSSGSALGGDAPAGQGVRTGGEQGGGSDVDTDTGGDTLGNEPGFRAPTANSGSWATGGSGYNSDAAYATADSGVTHDYANFGFSIPSNNTITGIEVKIEGAGSTAAGEIQVAITDGGDPFTSTKTTGTLTATDAIYTLGSPSDTWGHSWTPGETADGSFILQVTAVPSGNTVKIDAIRVNINHQSSGGGQGGGAEVRRHTDQYFALLPGAGMVAGASIEHKNQYETLVTTLDKLTTLLLKMRSEIKP